LFLYGQTPPLLSSDIGSLCTQYASLPHLHKTLCRFADEVVLKSGF
jgi:hypothetical protein